MPQAAKFPKGEPHPRQPGARDARPALRPGSGQAKFAPDPERRVLIAKVHVAKKEMNLLDDDYRAMLIRVTGRASSADCTIPELRAMVEEMKRKGFQPRPARAVGQDGRARKERPADHPFAAKARALWISLYHLGAIHNPSEQALEAFARRQLGCLKMQWANQQQSYKLVEALKAIAERHGWSQKIVSTRGLKPVAADVALRILKVRLVERIAHLLGERKIIPIDWPLGRIAFELAGMERPDATGGSLPVPLWDLGDLDLLAKALGEKLRDATGGQSGGLAPREHGQ